MFVYYDFVCVFWEWEMLGLFGNRGRIFKKKKTPLIETKTNNFING